LFIERRKKVISKFYRVFVLIIVLAGFQTAFAQYTNRLVAVEPENVTVIYNNGEFRTGATSESGVAAPNGYVWSENARNAGVTTESNSVSGFGASFPQVRLADNFTVPQGQVWRISSVTVWGFVQNWTAAQSPFSGGVLQIWNGAPGTQGASVIFGDLTTDRLLSSTPSNAYAIFNSVAPAPGNTTGTTRFLWENKLSIAPTITLGPGTYWIDFGTTSYNNVAASFYRNVITPGSRTQAGWDARQFTLSSNAWAPIVDGGQPSTAPDVAQDIAFKVNGTISRGNNASKFADYDGDGKTDFGVTRWGIGPLDPTEWFIKKSGGSETDYGYAKFGTRAGTNRNYNGASLLDIVLPEDYDGDGKADIAVYRAGDSSATPQSYFYIINSSDNTIRIEPWGLRFDVGSIMGDYDGDGKADLAVWRPGATTGAQSTFYVKKSSDGGMIAVDWGIRADRPVLGDYDGDGKQDFSVARVNTVTGEAALYTLHSSDGSNQITPLAYPFQIIVPGDYDGDGKTDIATIKNSVLDMLWTITRSSDGVTENIRAGTYATDAPVQGDYNGDGITDIAVFRKTGTGSANPSSFWVRQADGSYSVTPWGHGFDFSIATVRVY